MEKANFFSESIPNACNKDPKKFFIASLPSDISKKAIINHFSKFGKIDLIELAIDFKDPNICKGHGCITFGVLFEDQDVILGNKHVVRGREISCEIFLKSGKEQKNRNKQVDKLRVFLSNIPLWVSDSRLKELMGKFGRVKKAYSVKKYGTDMKCQYGYAFFYDLESVNRCLESRFLAVEGEKIMFQRFTRDKGVKLGQKRKREMAISKKNYRVNKDLKGPGYTQGYQDPRQGGNPNQEGGGLLWGNLNSSQNWGFFKKFHPFFPSVIQAYPDQSHEKYNHEDIRRNQVVRMKLPFEGDLKNEIQMHVLLPYSQRYHQVFGQRKAYFSESNDRNYRLNKD